MDEELETLRKQALEVIQARPEEKRVEMWHIVRDVYARKEAAQNG